jgi:hypothetical protein
MFRTAATAVRQGCGCPGHRLAAFAAFVVEAGKGFLFVGIAAVGVDLDDHGGEPAILGNEPVAVEGIGHHPLAQIGELLGRLGPALQ